MTTDRSSGDPAMDESATSTSQLPIDVPGQPTAVTTPLPSTTPPSTPPTAPPAGPEVTAPAAAPSSAVPLGPPAPGPGLTAPPPTPGTAEDPVFGHRAASGETTPSGPRSDLSAPASTNGTAPTAAAGSLGAGATFAPPSGPPARYRPDASAGAGSPAGPPTKPDSIAAPPPVRAVTPGPGWGWRALVAFVAGGLLTGGGFAIAQIDRNGDVAVDASSVEPTALTTSSVPDRSSDPTSSLPPAPAGVDAAAFVAETLGPSVVQVETNLGIGSGVIYDDGLILTNHHVIEGATAIRVQLKDGRRLPAEVLGSDENVDIAVVSVGQGEDLPIATLATGEVPQVGQTAIAIGSPFQLQQTVTEGIVSAVNRPVPTGGIYTAMIQTDAPINPGNSGGALADRSARVLGINTAIQTDGNSNTNAGIGFAIPIDTAVSVADRIVAGIPIQAGFLGVSGGQSIDGSAGVQVTSITDGSAADDAGIVVGDLILSIGGAPVTAFEELAGLVVARAPGDVVEIEVVRNGESLTVEATLGARED